MNITIPHARGHNNHLIVRVPRQPTMTTLPTLEQIADVVGQSEFDTWKKEATFAAHLHHGTHGAEYYHAYEWSFLQQRYRDWMDSYVSAQGVNE